tara:strand:- start:589 stop:1890 length:1302 start_codon:yes stop_codon:yes gene_type:complete
MTKLKLLDLFSGIGGFSLGLERTGGFETVAFCEYDKKARLVLNKHWPDVPIYEDVRTLEHDGSIDVISGGFPCQPFSVAGKQKGKEDDRHLWPAMFKLIQKHRPTWVIGENVAGLIALGLDSVLADLESENYRTRTFVIPACSVNAKHRRDRLWIIGERVVGNTKHDGSSTSKVRRGTIKTSIDNTKGQSKTFEFEGTSKPSNNGSVVNTNSKRCKELNIPKEPKKQKQSNRSDDEVMANSTSRRCKKFRWAKPNETTSKWGKKKFKLCSKVVADTNSTRQQQGDKKMERRPPEQPNGSSIQSKKIASHTNGSRRWKGKQSLERKPSEHSDSSNIDPRKVVTDTDKQRLQRGLQNGKSDEKRRKKSCNGRTTERSDWWKGCGDSQWAVEPSVGRVVDGFPGRVDRLKQLGNAVVPQIVEVIGNAILEAEKLES